MISMILAAVTAVLVLVGDRISKIYVLNNFTLAESHDFIPGVIDFTFVNNSGGAWGLLSGHLWILLSVSILAMMVCIALLIKYGLENKLMFWAVLLVLSGGIGNMYDRIFYGGEVVDFIHLSFMPWFPVFNIADCAIVIGGALFVWYFMLSTIQDSRSTKHIAYSTTDDEPHND